MKLDTNICQVLSVLYFWIDCYYIDTSDRNICSCRFLNKFMTVYFFDGVTTINIHQE